MNERDELAAIIDDALGDNNNGNLNKFVADAILAAGYVKPRTRNRPPRRNHPVTAAEYQALASDAERATLQVRAATERLRAFDYDAPLPPLKIQPRERIWEPAARRYRDLTESEKDDQ